MIGRRSHEWTGNVTDSIGSLQVLFGSTLGHLQHKGGLARFQRRGREDARELVPIFRSDGGVKSLL